MNITPTQHLGAARPVAANRVATSAGQIATLVVTCLAAHAVSRRARRVAAHPGPAGSSITRPNAQTDPIRVQHDALLRLTVAPAELDPAVAAINLGTALRDIGLHALTEHIPLDRWADTGALLRAASSVYNGFVHQLDPNTTGIVLSCPYCGRPIRKAHTQPQAVAALNAHIHANKGTGPHPSAIPTPDEIAHRAAAGAEPAR